VFHGPRRRERRGGTAISLWERDRDVLITLTDYENHIVGQIAEADVEYPWATSALAPGDGGADRGRGAHLRPRVRPARARRPAQEVLRRC
jgi:hypothetical protein